MSRSTPSRTLAAAAAAFALGGLLTSCGDDSPAPSGGFSAATAADLDGHRFVSTKVTGRDLVNGTQLTVSFEDGRVSANAGCNGIGGSVTIEDGRLTQADDGVQTMMFCGQPIMDQEEWFSSLLQSGVVAAVKGDALRLSGRGVTIDLVQRDTKPTTPPITGTRWELVSLTPRGGEPTPIPSGAEPPTLEIAGDGSAKIFFGCNRGGATTRQEGGFVIFSNVASTRRLCRGDAAALEQAVKQVLNGQVAAGFEGDQLSLAKDGSALLFRPR